MRISEDTVKFLKDHGCKTAHNILGNAEFYSFKSDISFHLEIDSDENELMYFLPEVEE